MRSVLLVTHAARHAMATLACGATEQLRAAGFEVRMLADEAEELDNRVVTRVQPDGGAADGTELVLVFGGDGTFLRAAELARPAGVPMLGVNLGHVGFLAEAEPHALVATVEAIARGDYTVDERTTVDAQLLLGEQVIGSAWALNEVSLERTNRERMLSVAVAVDGRPLQRFGCDGVLCATPTGSTAYAFSAGGPIVWPNVDALVVVPNAAHALFSRPIVVAPSSTVDIQLTGKTHEAVLSCDGRRSLPVPAEALVRITRGAQSIRIARVADWSFVDRLVGKFDLPIRSFREANGSVDDLDEELGEGIGGSAADDGQERADNGPAEQGPGTERAG